MISHSSVTASCLQTIKNDIKYPPFTLKETPAFAFDIFGADSRLIALLYVKSADYCVIHINAKTESITNYWYIHPGCFLGT